MGLLSGGADISLTGSGLAATHSGRSTRRLNPRRMGWPRHGRHSEGRVTYEKKGAEPRHKPPLALLLWICHAAIEKTLTTV